MDLKQFREIIRDKPLLETEIPLNPFELLRGWIRDAIDSGIRQPNAMNLATVSKDQCPKSRVVLLKEILDHRMTFFTNYESHKSQELDANNNVALNFLWFDINRQIRIEGTAKKTSREYSENYFKSRPRESQIAAITSQQSEKIGSREELEHLYREYEEKHEGKELSCPSFWGGYEVDVHFFEFWQGRSGRLHDRIVFERKENNQWEMSRLNP